MAEEDGIGLTVARTTRQKERQAMQFCLTVPHDSAEEPTITSVAAAELEATLTAVEESPATR